MTEALDAAIRATCWNIAPPCAWPDCSCEGHPTVVRLALRAALPEAPPLTLIDAMAAAICETDDDDAWVLAHATYRAHRAHLLGDDA